MWRQALQGFAATRQWPPSLPPEAARAVAAHLTTAPDGSTGVAEAATALLASPHGSSLAPPLWEALVRRAPAATAQVAAAVVQHAPSLGPGAAVQLQAGIARAPQTDTAAARAALAVHRALEARDAAPAGSGAYAALLARSLVGAEGAAVLPPSERRWAAAMADLSLARRPAPGAAEAVVAALGAAPEPRPLLGPSATALGLAGRWDLAAQCLAGRPSCGPALVGIAAERGDWAATLRLAAEGVAVPGPTLGLMAAAAPPAVAAALAARAATETAKAAALLAHARGWQDALSILESCAAHAAPGERLDGTAVVAACVDLAAAGQAERVGRLLRHPAAPRLRRRQWRSVVSAGPSVGFSFWAGVVPAAHRVALRPALHAALDEAPVAGPSPAVVAIVAHAATLGVRPSPTHRALLRQWPRDTWRHTAVTPAFLAPPRRCAARAEARRVLAAVSSSVGPLTPAVRLSQFSAAVAVGDAEALREAGRSAGPWLSAAATLLGAATVQGRHRAARWGGVPLSMWGVVRCAAGGARVAVPTAAAVLPLTSRERRALRRLTPLAVRRVLRWLLAAPAAAPAAVAAQDVARCLQRHRALLQSGPLRRGFLRLALRHAAAGAPLPSVALGPLATPSDALLAAAAGLPCPVMPAPRSVPAALRCCATPTATPRQRQLALCAVLQDPAHRVTRHLGLRLVELNAAARASHRHELTVAACHMDPGPHDAGLAGALALLSSDGHRALLVAEGLATAP